MIVTPRCWHIYTVDLEPRIGTKPGKQRPCLAIQPNEFAEGGLQSTVILPLTSKIIAGDEILRHVQKKNISHNLIFMRCSSY